MFQSIKLTRFRRHLLLGAVAAATIIPSAGAVGQPPDVQDAASANRVAQLTPPDVRDAALATSAVAPDVFERFAAAHPFGTSLSTTPAPRPPDVSDAALAARYSSVGGPSNSFDWSDWAIGIASGIGLALVLGTALLMSRQVRQRVRTA